MAMEFVLGLLLMLKSKERTLKWIRKIPVVAEKIMLLEIFSFLKVKVTEEGNQYPLTRFMGQQ